MSKRVFMSFRVFTLVLWFSDAKVLFGTCLFPASDDLLCSMVFSVFFNLVEVFCFIFVFCLLCFQICSKHDLIVPSDPDR